MKSARIEMAGNNSQKKAQGKSIIRLSLFDRPLASGKVAEKFTFYSYFTFMNIVIGLGVITLLFFLGSAVSVPLAMLVATLIGFFLIILVEVSSRRKWEKDLISQLQKMTQDYDRLVRDVARTRNDAVTLRKKLSAAGEAAARHTKPASEHQPAEQRMLRALVEQLSSLGEAISDEQPEPEEPKKKPKPAHEPGEVANEGLTEEQVLRLVDAAIKQDRIDLFLQPIVALPQRKVRFYEMLSRIRIKADTYLPAARYINVAHKQDLMPIVDNLLLLRGLQIVRTTEDGNYNRAFFFNIGTLTLNDPKFMGDLVEFIAQNRSLAPRLIFEMGQGDMAAMSAEILPVLDGLSKLGCRFSMDQVRSLSLDLKQLEARHIRFIKLDASMLMDELNETGGLRRMKRLKDDLDRFGIDLIVEKIETDRQLLELLEIDIDYGQGYLFGKPTLYDKK
jgi:cyclic-di-GMP phosphodiesterase, flagellum assembly factor TipF